MRQCSRMTPERRTILVGCDVVDDPICCIARGGNGKVDRQTVARRDRGEILVLVEQAVKGLRIDKLSVLFPGLGGEFA